MQIIKTENLRFSDKEQQALDMTMTLMENIVRCAEDPQLSLLARDIMLKLGDLRLMYEEGVE